MGGHSYAMGFSLATNRWLQPAALFAAVLMAGPLCVTNAPAGPLEDGIAAYKAGDYGVAMELWRPLAEQGHVDAQLSLGVMYGFGEGVPKDDVQSAYWYDLAAKQGSAIAQLYLGVMYDTGRGVQQDDVKAYAWVRLSGIQGNVHAKAFIANLAAKMTPEQIAEARVISSDMYVEYVIPFMQ